VDVFAVFLYGILLLLGLGLSYWAERARTDRSANVGLYLLFGIPGSLLIIWGVASLVFGVRDGQFYLSVGLALSLPLVRPIRRALARVMPFDPDSPIDMCGLCLLLTVCAISGVALINVGTSLEADEIPEAIGLAELGLTALFEFLLALLTVGWLVRRTLDDSLRRLGISMPTLKTILIAIGFVIIAYVGGAVGSVLTLVFQPDLSEQIDISTQQLTADVQYPLGAVILGACAGIGEEALFRGAIQPRFGIVLTAMTFGLIHSQYGLSFVIFGLFLVGVTLGIERKYFGTPAAMITHATFNVIAVLAQSSS
jgi:uncharacterized protein